MPQLMGLEITAPKAKTPADPFPTFNTVDASTQVIPAKLHFPPTDVDGKGGLDARRGAEG